MASSHSNQYISNVLKMVAGRVGQKLERPFFHPFPARMPFGLAQTLIERLTENQATILDPMAGSGTTLKAAKYAGRTAIGYDLDPLAVLLSKAAIIDINPTAISESGERIKKRAQQFLQRLTFEAFLPSSKPEKTFVDYWFAPRTQKQLAALKKAIQLETDESLKDFFWVLFSSLIISKNGGASYARDLAHSRPHKDRTKKIEMPLDIWERRLKKAIKSIVQSQSKPITIQLADARNLPLDDESVDFILTSPPYLQAIDYVRTHKFSLIWLGKELDSLRTLRSSMIGARRIMSGPDGLPAHIENSLESQASPRSGHLRRYIADMQKVLNESFRVLKTHGLAILVMGPSILKQKRTDSANVISQLADQAGLEVAAIAKRRLPNARRALPPPSEVDAQNSLKKRMRTEILIALRKP